MMQDSRNTDDEVALAYSGDVELYKRIVDIGNKDSSLHAIFSDIATYVLTNKKLHAILNARETESEQPTKKRKLENGAAANSASQLEQTRSVILEARDVSFSLPQRKKLHLGIVQYGQHFNAPTTTFAVCARNPASNQVEFEYPLSTFSHAIRVPIPEKATKQYNFCLLPSTQATSEGSALAAGEGVIWTVNHGPLKSCQVHSEELKQLAPGPEDVLEKVLDAILRKHGNKLVLPTEAEFASATPEAIRRHEKAFHVKAFRGSKDGYLFFLETGIFFGFKKPLAFFPFHDVEAVSYTAVLQRTFNLVIVVRSNDSAEPQELEFAMLDQADFGGIDSYVKAHQLQDASMAEARRAKKFNINVPKGEQAGTSGEEASELEKAEAELQDEEDEMEEDYDPGSEGDSEGSGSSDEDDDYEYDRPTKGKDLVKDELGSEAEDISQDEEDGEGEEEEEEEEEEEVMVEEKPKAQRPPPVKTKVDVAKHKQELLSPLTHRGHYMPSLDDDDQL